MDVATDPVGDAEITTAIRADRQNVRRLAARERFAGALWPVPALFGCGALVAAVASVGVDDWADFQVHGSRYLVRDASTALTLTSVVATGMLAFLGIVFATTLVAIQLAASQYSPRAVRVFVRSRLTKVSLGIFISTFVYSVVTLIAVRSAGHGEQAFTPVFSVSGLGLLVIATLVAFLVFANGTARLLRVQYLIERIAQETRPALDAAFPLATEQLRVEAPRRSVAPTAVCTPTPGVVDAVDIGGLVELAATRDVWVEVTAPVGSHVASGGVVALLHTAGNGDAPGLEHSVLSHFLFTNERTLVQDPGFGFRQLVDIAIRALSPAVNDPTTAVQVVDRLTDLLGRVVIHPDPTGWYVDRAGAVRARLPVDTFDELVTLAFTETIRYGADSPQVVRRVGAALDELARRAPRSGVDAMRDLLRSASDESMPTAFRTLSAIADSRGLG